MNRSEPATDMKDRYLHVLLAAAAAALPFILYSQFLSNDAIIYTSDSGLGHYPRFKILCDAIQEEGIFPLWQTMAYSGSPFHANPETPNLYPPVLLLCAFLPPLLAMNLVILIHMSVAILGMYALVVRFWRRTGGNPAICAAGALVGALFFGLNHFTRMEHFELVAYGAAHALIPWIFLAADGLLNGAAPRRAAGWLALLLGAQIFTGGLYAYVYTAFGLVLWFLFLGLLGGREARRRTLTFGLLGGGLAFLIALAKLLPYLAWVPATHRTGPLDPEVALRITLASFSGPDSFSWKLLWQNLDLYTGKGFVLLFLPFVLYLFRSGAVRMASFLALAGFAIALGPPYELLYKWVPPFDQIRFPFRAWTLTNAFLPLLVGLGLNKFMTLDFMRYPRMRMKRMYALLCALPCAVFLVWLLHQSDNDWRLQYVSKPHSLKDVIEQYPNWKKMAGFAGKEWRAVSLDIRGPVRCNEQLIAVALGVETVAGFFGDAWPAELVRHAYPTRAWDVRRRRLAVLSVRHFTYTEKLAREQPVTERMEDVVKTILLVEGAIDGDRLGRIPTARPRAFIPGSVGALFGDREDHALYILHNARDFKADRIGFVTFDPGELPSDEELSALDEIIVIEREETVAPTFQDFLEKAKEMGCGITKVRPPLKKTQNDKLREVVARMDASIQSPIEQASFERVTSQEVRVARENARNGRFVILSETWNLYGGWKARADDREVPIRDADGVVCAVYLEGGEKDFIAEYEPREVFWGMLCSLFGFLGVIALIVLRSSPKG